MDNSPNLLIVRTPFQAWLCLRLVEYLEMDSYDLLYITHNDSEEDKFYFKRLSISAMVSDYVYLPPERFDVITHVKLRLRLSSWFRRLNYQNVYVASIDSMVINALICKISLARMYTFDDGLANLVQDGIYYNDPKTIRAWIYRKLFGGRPVDKIRKKVSLHYSIYKDFDNIVEEGRMVYLSGWGRPDESISDRSVKKHTKRYFLGAPFDEVMSRREIEKMVDAMQGLAIDAYIKHPREKKELPIGGIIFDKGGRIAEEVILEDSTGYAVELYGFLSSVMINLQGVAEKRVVFLSGHQKLTGVGELARKLGCQEVYLS